MAEEKLPFHEMGLDDRILKAVALLGWSTPTLIQDKAIPLALEGKDVLARAKTGSGKTGAYAIPLVQKILEAKRAGGVSSQDGGVSLQTGRGSSDEGCVRALVLVPSKELSQQAATNIKEISFCCFNDVKVIDVSTKTDVASQRMVTLERPDIVVGTPARVVSHLKHRTLHLKNSLEVLVIDEADLLFSFGYEEDLKNLLSYLPSIYQAFLMSATLTEEVQMLKKLLLHNPVILKLEEPDLPEESRLTQYQIQCSVEDKFLLVYALLKLNLVRGKTLLFVNNIDRCYKLKLYLEQFSIKSCVLNSELPHNSRCHVVNEFNRGIYDYIIATDEVGISRGGSKAEAERSGIPKGKSRKRKRDKEYGVARGIDFQGVENVINFDCPPSADAYVHRVGRTARGYEHGTALTFMTPDEQKLLSQLEERVGRAGGPASSGQLIKPYKFRMSEVEGFRYRVKDALRAVTKASIKEARLKEIRTEILNSKRLQTHFDENPRDLQVLRHDDVLQPLRVQPHLKYIPPYLVPKALQVPEASSSLDTADAAQKKRQRRNADSSSVKRQKSANRKPSSFQPKGKVHRRRKDPLRSFKQK